MSKFWTAARVAKLKRLDADGCSIREIAAALKIHPGAISSKRSRLGLTRSAADRKLRQGHHGRGRRVVPVKAPRPIFADLPVKASPPIASQFEPPSLGITFRQLESHHCRWSTHGATAETYLFCGHRRVGDAVWYCQHHLERSLPRPAERRANKPITVAA